MIGWILIAAFALLTVLWIGFDYRRTKAKLCAPLKAEARKRDDDTRVIQRQAVVKEAESKVIKRVEEIERIKHETEIIDLVQAAPALDDPEGTRSSNPATDTALLKIVTSKVDEAQKLADKRLAEGGLHR